MREDMFKVIVNRPRSGRSWAGKTKLRYDKCEERRCVTGRRLAYEGPGGIKYLNENLAPLKRYLHKQVGRKWDDVFSEICKHLDTGSTVKMHVREHLDDFVLRKVRQDENGSLIATRNWGDPEKVIDCYVELYVDPTEGVIKKTRDLCKAKGVQYRRDRYKGYRHRDGKWGPPPKPHPIKKIAPLSWHVRLSGIWYEVGLSAAPVWRNGRQLTTDDLFKFLDGKSIYESDHWRIVKKHQLSRKELKTLGLENVYNAKREANYG